MSNLLDKASIVLTPTAYDNGKVLCVKPSDGSGDFDFSRNSAATRVNAQGLVENVQTISGNLLDYSTFTSSSASWSLVGGLWVYDDTANGFILTPSIDVVVGDVFDVVIDLTIASGNANLRYSSGNAQTTLFNFTDFVDGVNKFQATVTGVDGFLQRLFAPASLTDNPFTLNSISIKKISQDTNLPRINYEGFSFDGSGDIIPDSGCGSWLFEPQSTNLIPYSEDFTVGNWTKSRCTLTSNQAISPDGTLNADLMTSTDDDARLEDQVGSSGAEYTQSIYVKSAQVSDVNCQIDFAGLNIVTFTANQQWQRVETTLTDTSISPRLRLRILNSGNSIYVWGGQVEQQTYSTSYIPTDGTSVTRNQDLCNNGGTGTGLINSTEGVLYAEIAALADDLTLRSICLSDGTTNNVAIIRYRGNSNRVQVVVFNGGTLQFSNSFDVSDILDFNKVAISYKQSDFNFWVNGVKRANSTSGNTPIGLNEVSFNGGASSDSFFGKTKAVAVWKETLTDLELQKLTTI